MPFTRAASVLGRQLGRRAASSAPNAEAATGKASMNAMVMEAAIGTGLGIVFVAPMAFKMSSIKSEINDFYAKQK